MIFQGWSKVIENNVVHDDSDQPSPVYGYHAHALAGGFKDPRSVGFTVHAGGKFAGRAVLEFGEYDVAPDLTIVTYQLFKAALLAINAVWLAPWACAQASRMGVIKVPINFGGAQAVRLDRVRQVPSDPTFPDWAFHVPWIAYLSAPLATGLKLTSEILTERTPDWADFFWKVSKSAIFYFKPKGAAKALMACAITVAWNSCARADGSSLPYGRGGMTFPEMDRIVQQYNKTGELFRIEGECRSSCTELLAIKNVCIDPDAMLEFHAAIRTPEQMVDPAKNKRMASYYNSGLRNFVLTNHFMDSWTFHPIAGQEVIQKFGYRRCPGR